MDVVPAMLGPNPVENTNRTKPAKTLVLVPLITGSPEERDIGKEQIVPRLTHEVCVRQSGVWGKANEFFASQGRCRLALSVIVFLLQCILCFVGIRAWSWSLLL